MKNKTVVAPHVEYSINDAFKKLDLITEGELFDVSDDDDLKALKDFMDDDEEKTDIETVIDLDAEIEDDLKQSYEGKVIVECSTCRTKFYKDTEEIEPIENDEEYCILEECEYCNSSDYFRIVGKVVPFDSESESENNEELEDDIQELNERFKRNVRSKPPVEYIVKMSDPISGEDSFEHFSNRGKAINFAINNNGVKVMEVINDVEDIIWESGDEAFNDYNLNEAKFDKLINKYLTKVYENISSYTTTSGKYQKINGIDNLIVEGVLKFKSGRSCKTAFLLENRSKGGEMILRGSNNIFSRSKNAFTFKGTNVKGNLIPESLTYNYTAKRLNESKKIYGRVN